MRKSLLVLGLLVIAAAACQTREDLSRSRSASATPTNGCAAATSARASALDAIDKAEKKAQRENPARLRELAAIASAGKGAVAEVVDLAPCDDARPETGLVVEIEDLRRRYDVVVQRTTTELALKAAQPVPPPAPVRREKDDDDKDRGEGKDKKEDRSGSNSGKD